MENNVPFEWMIHFLAWLRYRVICSIHHDDDEENRDLNDHVWEQFLEKQNQWMRSFWGMFLGPKNFLHPQKTPFSLDAFFQNPGKEDKDNIQDMPSKRSSQKPIVVALQGGGAHGAFSWGVLDYLMQHGGFFVEGISGTSAGAMNAAAFMQGFSKGNEQGARRSMKEFWQKMSAYSVLSPYKPSYYDHAIGNYNLNHSFGNWLAHQWSSYCSPYQWNPMNTNPLAMMIRDFFDFSLLRSCQKMKIFLCATRVETGKLKIFSNKDISKEVLLASACLPRLFHAVKVGENYYWDGGYAGNPAIFPLIEHCQSQDIVVIQLTPQSCEKIPKNIQNIRDRLMEINSNVSLLREMRAITFVTKLLDEGKISEPFKKLRIHLIRNETVFTHLSQKSAMNAEWDFLSYLFRKGRETAKDWVSQHQEDVGKRSSVDLSSMFVEP